MTQFFTLFKMLFVSHNRIKKTTTQDKKKVGSVILVVFICLAFLPLIGMVIFGMYEFGTICNNSNFLPEAISYIMLFCQMFVVMFGIPNLIAIVYDGKDSDLLLTLPVTPTMVFSAKMLLVYVNELLVSVATSLAMFVPFGIGAGMGVGYYLLVIPTVLLLPLLPMLLGSVIALLVSLILNKIGSTGTVRTVLRIVLFTVLICAYALFLSNLGYDVGAGVAEEATIGDLVYRVFASMRSVLRYIHPNYPLAEALTATTSAVFLVSIALALLENLALLVLTVAITSPFYKKTLIANVEGDGNRKKHGKVSLESNNKGVIWQLITTDFKRILRDSQLGFQSFAGVLIMPFVAIILSISLNTPDESGVSQLAQLMSQAGYSAVCSVLLTMYMMFLGSCANALGLYPISRENKSAYMLKVVPVPFDKILTAKVLLATAVLFVECLLTAIISSVAFGISWYYCVAMIVALSAFSYGNMCFSTLQDLKSPILDWSNFNKSLKNSKNVFVAIGIALLAVLAILAVFLLSLWAFSVTEDELVFGVMWLILCGVGVVYAYLAHGYMVKRADTYFARIEM